MDLVERLNAAIGANDLRLPEVVAAAHRKILAEHRHDQYDRACLGCGLGSDEEPRVPDVDDCPVVCALAEIYGLEP